MEQVSYWLVPAKPDRETLAGTIRALALRFGGPVFEPHLTIFSGLFASARETSANLRRVAGDLPAITIHVTGVAHSEQFTKTLFIECTTEPALIVLNEALKKLCGAANYELKPHVSLLYARLSNELRQSLVAEMAVPREIRFDLMRAVLTGNCTRHKQDVEAWQPIADLPLRG